MKRRTFVAGTGALIAGSWARPSRALSAGNVPEFKVAAVVTAISYRSHGHVILENFLEPYPFCGQRIDHKMRVVSLYVDQYEENELTRAITEKYKVPVYSTIAEALCQGGKELAADGVLSIGEHGSYPSNALGQVEYPRKRFFDEIVAVFRRSGRVVPLFNDKHLSVRYADALEMVETARQMSIPFLAGSSVPLAQRIPHVEFTRGAQSSASVSVHGGPVESYDFHAMEVALSLLEFRKGGETGVRQVNFLDHDGLLTFLADEKEHARLAAAALDAESPRADEEIQDRLQRIQLAESGPKGAGYPLHGITIEHTDGHRLLIIGVGAKGTRWCFAWNEQAPGGETMRKATRFHTGPWDNRNLFKALSFAIQTHFREGAPPYPVERTLMVSGILDAMMHSRGAGQPVATPELEFSYESKDFARVRENGNTWDTIVPADAPQPAGIDPTGSLLGR